MPLVVVATVKGMEMLDPGSMLVMLAWACNEGKVIFTECIGCIYVPQWQVKQGIADIPLLINAFQQPLVSSQIYPEHRKSDHPDQMIQSKSELFVQSCL